jgi:hypothetical protein
MSSDAMLGARTPMRRGARRPNSRAQQQARLAGLGIGAESELRTPCLGTVATWGVNSGQHSHAPSNISRPSNDAPWVCLDVTRPMNGRHVTAVKYLLSPYPADRSAATDCVKLAKENLPCRKAMLICGFEVTERPLDLAIAAFETLVRTQVRLSGRHERAFGPLVNPFHTSGRLVGWEFE